MTNIDYDNVLMYEFDGEDEFQIYCKVFKNEIGNKQVVWSKGTDYIDLFKKAYVLNEEHQFKKAIKQLESALKFNPIGLAARFEMIESYIGLKDYKNAKEAVLSTKDILTSDSLIARFYRRLGFVYCEETNYELAYSCFKQSLKYEVTDRANTEIKYISSIKKIGSDFDIEAELKKNNIPLISKIGKEYSNEKVSSRSEIYAVHNTVQNKALNENADDKKSETKEIKYVYCRKCGEKITEDSRFCNKCATEVIKSDNSKVKTTKKCKDCEQLVFDDSVYCHSCGSKNIEKYDKDFGTKNATNFKIPMIISCFVALIAIVFCFNLYSENLNYKEQIEENGKTIDNLNTKVSNAEKKAKKYITQAERFTSVSSALADKKINNSYRADYYYLKNPSNKKVTIYTSNSYAGCTFTSSTTGGVSMKWGDNCYVGSQGCPIYVTNNGSSGTLTISNNYDSNKIVIYVEGK